MPKNDLPSMMQAIVLNIVDEGDGKYVRREIRRQYEARMSYSVGTTTIGDILQTLQKRRLVCTRMALDLAGKRIPHRHRWQITPRGQRALMAVRSLLASRT